MSAILLGFLKAAFGGLLDALARAFADWRRDQELKKAGAAAAQVEAQKERLNEIAKANAAADKVRRDNLDAAAGAGGLPDDGFRRRD